MDTDDNVGSKVHNLLMHREMPTRTDINNFLKSIYSKEEISVNAQTLSAIINKLMVHKSNERKKEFSTRYDTNLKVYIPQHVFNHRGDALNETAVKDLNVFIEKQIKKEFRFLMDQWIEILPNFMTHLPQLRRKLGIDIEAWDDDSMRKDYYRYRKAKGLPPLYDKISARSVPSKRKADYGW